MTDILVWRIQHSPVLDGPNNDYRQKSISESNIQDLTDEYISKIDKIYLIKEKEILSV